MRKVVWINGWGLSASYIEEIATSVYPKADHVVVLPKPGWEEMLMQQPRAATVVAYSLGAFLLLGRPDLSNRFDRSVFVAPFEDFKKESKKGGRVRLTQLRYLRRWLKSDKEAAIFDFMTRAGLKSECSNPGELSKAGCVWGIDRLINDSAEPGSLLKCEALIGEADRLLDAEQMRRVYPNIKILEGAGHDLGELLKMGSLDL